MLKEEGRGAHSDEMCAMSSERAEPTEAFGSPVRTVMSPVAFG